MFFRGRRIQNGGKRGIRQKREMFYFKFISEKIFWKIVLVQTQLEEKFQFQIGIQGQISAMDSVQNSWGAEYGSYRIGVQFSSYHLKHKKIEKSLIFDLILPGH